MKFDKLKTNLIQQLYKRTQIKLKLVSFQMENFFFGSKIDSVETKIDSVVTKIDLIET